MSEGYHCDSCKKLFAGIPAMELSAIFRDDDFQQKRKGDGEYGDYCAKCATDILEGIGKRWSK